jgi:hypothetical protein
MSETTKRYAIEADESRARGISAGCEHCLATDRALGKMLEASRAEDKRDEEARMAESGGAGGARFFGGLWLIITILFAMAAFAVLVPHP